MRHAECGDTRELIAAAHESGSATNKAKVGYPQSVSLAATPPQANRSDNAAHDPASPATETDQSGNPSPLPDTDSKRTLGKSK
ncbi:hypothetical protein ACQPZ2_07180 [Nocardia pseudovaccinii]|uniref:hypothetical protein n=1 Tax=Nocardia pseudovaccinii TaxID=189540 RepID=UPI003D8C22A9